MADDEAAAADGKQQQDKPVESESSSSKSVAKAKSKGSKSKTASKAAPAVPDKLAEAKAIAENIALKKEAQANAARVKQLELQLAARGSPDPKTAQAGVSEAPSKKSYYDDDYAVSLYDSYSSS